jgi:acetyl-CoA carboxylase carboxyl transferase subunit beta
MSRVAPRTWADVKPVAKRNAIPEGLWLRCPSCEKMVYRKQMEANFHVCPECDHHYRISASERVRQLSDPGSFEPMFTELRCADPLRFTDMKPYPERIAEANKLTGQNEGCLAGVGFVKGRQVMLCCLDLTFMMGSMGSVVGETITRSIEAATERDLPLIIVSCSGGARMQESGLSLMQMAKTSAALAKFDEKGGLFISVLTDPTTGGVTASFAMLGDVIFAEPKALICFAGPRVIQQTIRQALPEGFQRAEFLLKAGMVDRVVHRNELRNEIARVVDYAGK